MDLVLGHNPKQLFIGKARNAPGLGDLVLVIEVENARDQFRVHRELILATVLAVDNDCVKLVGRNDMVLERELADAGAGRGVETVQHARVLHGSGAVMNDNKVLGGPRQSAFPEWRSPTR